MKLLFAEDEFTNRKLMEIKMQKAGIEYDVADNGQVALDMFKKGAYSVVILDQYMPGMNGSRVAKEIRKKNKDIPIIGITSDETQRSHMIAEGFTDVFIKPLRNQDYITTLKQYLE